MAVGRVVLVTGASSGIGEAASRLLSQKGFRVALAARRMERLQSLAEEILSMGGDALPLKADVTRLEDIQGMVQAVLDHYGQIDVLFNNAGFGRLDWLETLDPVVDIERQLQVNLLGLILTTQAVLPHMIAQRSGHIINMSSLAAFIATPTYSIYAASKFGVRGFTDALRREVSLWNIQVSGIYPGGVRTEFEGHTGVRRKTGLRTPTGLKLQAEQVAQAVLRVVEHPRRTVILPGVMKAAVWMNLLLPGFVDWVIERRFTRREREV